METENPKVTLSVTVWMRPTGKGRPRFKRVGNFVTTYTPADTKKAQSVIAQEWTQANGTVPPRCYPLRMTIKAMYKMPETWSKKKQSAFDGRYCHSYADGDNVQKLVSDALNGIAYNDDREIAVWVYEKQWGREDKVQITVDYEWEEERC